MRRTYRRELIIIFIFFISFSCKVKNASTTAIDEVNQETEYISKGFFKAKIVEFENEDDNCNYLIMLYNGDLLEPLLLADSMKVNNSAIWIKYQNQRRPSRCEGSQAVEITEMIRRE